MPKIPRRRPSPALVIASIALFVSLGGVAYGVATVGTNDIQNGAVTNKKIRNRTILNLDVRRQTLTGSRIRESTLGTVPRADGLAKHGVINSTGSFVRGRGVVSSARLATGLYQVVFNRQVGTCSYIATVGDPGAANSPLPGFASVATDPVNGNAVRVRTRNQNGTVVDRAFHIAVSCG
ncbi:MAG TPA: hypothetical protein VKB17_09785 [Thermoleophilaceae bacterium]|nr:hypothetical protein [Thermoleophilaceae bacterium]